MKSLRQIVKGILLRGETSDVSENINGSLWYNSTSNRLKGYFESAIRTIVSENQTQTLSNKTLDNSNAATLQDSNLTIQDNADATKQLKFEASGITTGTTRTLTAPDANTTIVGTDATQTLSNKTLDNTTTANIKDSNLLIQDNADATKQMRFETSGITAGQTRVLTSPDANTTIVGIDVAQTLSNKTLDNTNIATIQDSNLTIQDNADNTKQLKFQASGITTGTTRTLTSPDADTVIVGTDVSQTLTNKTLTDSTTFLQDEADNTKKLQFQLSGITTGTTRTLTAPDANTTIVGTDATQSLSNKTLDNTNIATIKDANLTIQDDADTTKQLKFQASGITTGTTRTLTAPDANTTIVGTDATQTLSAKTFSDAPILAEIATPSTPSSGFGKIYFKSDGFLYQLNDDGTETKVGSGAGGINYITNSDLESNVTGYSAYANAAGVAPVDGTGGSPTVTATRSTSSPLRGTASLLLTKDAANRQGEGISYDFSIATADKAKVLQGSFEYAISSGTFADDDVRMYIYDVTNAALIYPTPYLLKNHTLAAEKFNFEFQTSSSSTSYRLIFHVASTSASAYTLKFDTISVGPQAKLYGSPVTDLVTYTPTLNSTSNVSSNVAYWRRDGDSIEVRGRIVWNGAGHNSTLSVQLPSGLTLDTSKISYNNTGDATKVGYGDWLDSGTDFNTLSVVKTGTNLTTVYFIIDQGTGVFNSNACANGDEVSYFFKLPISGWGSQVVMSNDASTRVIAMKATGAPPTGTLSNTNQNDVIFGTMVNDTHGAYATGTGIYTAPVSGYYDISACVILTGTFSSHGDAELFIFVNGSSVASKLTINSSASGTMSYDVHAKAIYVQAGQAVKIRLTPNSWSSVSYGSTATENYFTLHQVQGPSQIAASETVLVVVSGDPASATSGNPIIWPTKDIDTHGGYNTSTGRYTVPISGYYKVSGNFQNTATAATIYIYKNAVQNTSVGALDADFAFSWVSGIVQCVAGDIIDLRPNATVDVNSTGQITFERLK